jgi:hypothetical protein
VFDLSLLAESFFSTKALSVLASPPISAGRVTAVLVSVSPDS